MNLNDVIIKPIMTEKSEDLRKEGKYVFQVIPSANKELVKLAVSTLFDVKIEKVNIMNVRGKLKRFRNSYAPSANWKKAIVTLKKGDKLDFYEGM